VVLPLSYRADDLTYEVANRPYSSSCRSRDPEDEMGECRKYTDRNSDREDADASWQVALDSVCHGLHGSFSDLYRSEGHMPDASLSA
jgi:hypothetical protein